MHTQEILALVQQHAAGATARNRLAELLNHMILHDFEGLVQLLYRQDVPERQVRLLLQQHAQQDAGQLLAELLVQRQCEKEAARKQYRQPDEDIPEADRW